MATSYYGENISKNVTETEEGYLICRNAVLARTGFQTYRVGELGEKHRAALKSFGLDLNDDDEVEFYRSAEEVFKPAYLQSLEGKALTNLHPEELIDCETHAESSVGHVQDVAKGDEPLDSGDWPISGTVHINDIEAVREYRGGRRELSCGYTYDIVQDGNRILQVNLIGNHVALVPKGRGGKHVRIYDHAIDDLPREPFVMSKFLEEIKRRGRLAWAKDAKPEEVAEAMDEMEKSKKAEDADEHPKGCRCSDCDKDGKDAKMAKDAKAAKDAEEAKAKEAKDAEDEPSASEAMEMLEDLKAYIKSDEDAGEDAEEDEDEDEESKADDADVIAPILAPEDRPKSIMAKDAAMVSATLSPFIKLAKDSKLSAAFDAVKDSDDPVTMLKGIRRQVARSSDRKLKGAFDTAAKLVNTRAKTNDAYAVFTKAATARSGAAMDSVSRGESGITDSAKRNAEIEAEFAKHRGKAL